MEQSGMRKNKNIPAIIMLCAGAIAVICCIINRFSLLNTLKVTLVVLLLFYVIGLIAGKFIIKINEEATQDYINHENETQEEIEAENLEEELEEDIQTDQTTATKEGA